MTKLDKDAFFTKAGYTDNWFTRAEFLKDLGDGTNVLVTIERTLVGYTWTLIHGRNDDYEGFTTRWTFNDRPAVLEAYEAFPDNPPAGYEPEGFVARFTNGSRRAVEDPESRAA